jgi:soluble lytic murein transglycosylase-like protein
MNKLLKSITKEEWIIGGAVALLVYVIFSNKKSSRGTSKSSKSGSSRLVVDDPTLKRVDFPVDLEERFKQVAGSNYDRFIQDLNEIGLDKEIAMRQLYAESSYSPSVINCSISSSAGAKGIAQFMPSTWTAYGGGGNICNVGDSLKAYPRLMKDLMKQFPNRIDLALAGYNWGSNRSVLKNAYTNNTPYEEYKSGLPAETKKYVASILRP